MCATRACGSFLVLAIYELCWNFALIGWDIPSPYSEEFSIILRPDKSTRVFIRLQLRFHSSLESFASLLA